MEAGADAIFPEALHSAELYAAIDYHDYEALDASIVATVVATGKVPQRG